jgi:hypothetical protein
MRSSLQSTTFVFVTSLLVGISGGARAEEPVAEPGPSVEAAMTEPASCVSLADNVLDFRVFADASDVWSFDANTGMGSRDLWTLYVLTDKPTITISTRFDKLADRMSIVDVTGEEQWLVPVNTRDFVKTDVALTSAGVVLSAVPSAAAAFVAPKPVGYSKKVVIKPVTTCPSP